MLITRDVINEYFITLMSSSDKNILSKDGFIALADWSEQQKWWHDFAKSHSLGTNWRDSSMGDPYIFSVALFRFIIHLRPENEMTR